MGRNIVVLFSFILMLLNSQAHEIDSLFGEFEKGDDGWAFKLTFDAALAVPDLRNDSDAPQPTREWLVGQSKANQILMKKEAERLLGGSLKFTYGEDLRDFQIYFPDFDTDPQGFPKLLNGGAYFNVLLIGNGVDVGYGEFQIHVSEGEFPSLIVANRIDEQTHYLTISPGQAAVIFESDQLGDIEPLKRENGSLIQLGFSHVLIDGVDHLLFIVALFFVTRKWRVLLMQSLVFTVAHCLTLGLCVSRFIRLEEFPVFITGLIEPVIALSILYLGVENLMRDKVTTTRLSVVFLFGLVHGFGFASSLQTVLEQMDSPIVALVLMNLGIELAQVFILVLLWFGTRWISKSESRYNYLRKGVSWLIVITAVWLTFDRL